MSFDWKDPDGDNDHWRLELTQIVLFVEAAIPSESAVLGIAPLRQLQSASASVRSDLFLIH